MTRLTMGELEEWLFKSVRTMEEISYCCKEFSIICSGNKEQMLKLLKWAIRKELPGSISPISIDKEGLVRKKVKRW